MEEMQQSMEIEINRLKEEREFFYGQAQKYLGNLQSTGNQGYHNDYLEYLEKWKEASKMIILLEEQLITMWEF